MIKIYTNRIKKTYTISRADYKRACIFGTDEYYKLEEAIDANPDYTIKLRTVTRNEETKSYLNLTYANMEIYIREADSQNFPQFKKVKNLSKAQSSPYMFVREWFLAEYPNYADSKIFASQKTEEQESTDAAPQAAKETKNTTPMKKAS